MACRVRRQNRRRFGLRHRAYLARCTARIQPRSLAGHCKNLSGLRAGNDRCVPIRTIRGTQKKLISLARALLTGAPDAGDAAFWESLGIPPEMRDGIVSSAAVTPIWQENETSFALFASLQTQWRIGMGGPTGLDYSAVPVVMELYSVPEKDRRQVFDDVRVMESEALKVFNEKHGRNK